MAEQGRLKHPPALGAVPLSPVTAVRIAIIVGVLAIWQAVSVSGLLFGDVVPSLLVIGQSLIKTLLSGEFYYNLGWTVYEIVVGLAVGGSCGIAAGLLLGGSPLLSKAYERLIYYLGPTPKVIFFPVMIMWFGVGPGSKMAMASLSCFFPIVLNTAAGMREIDKVLIRVGRSFRLSTPQMVRKIYLPAMRLPVLTGIRLGLGVAMIGTLLAETRLANRGIGYIIIQSYNNFDMPYMYALLLLLFALAIGANTLMNRLGGSERMRR
jgi:ABC-type nitrate/sulfonate/bicarbonate transport system permease component